MKGQRARTTLMLLANELPEKTRWQAAYSYEEMVAFCRYNNVPCQG